MNDIPLPLGAVRPGVVLGLNTSWTPAYTRTPTRESTKYVGVTLCGGFLA